MQEGIITKGIGGFYYVLSDEAVYDCKAICRCGIEKIIPIVGDKVVIEVKNGKGSIASP